MCTESMKKLKLQDIVKDYHRKFVGREESIQVIDREISTQRSKTVMSMSLFNTIETPSNYERSQISEEK